MTNQQAERWSDSAPIGRFWNVRMGLDGDWQVRLYRSDTDANQITIDLDGEPTTITAAQATQLASALKDAAEYRAEPTV